MTPRRFLTPEAKRAEFEAVALPFLDAVHRAAVRLTRCSDDTGDLVQETYLRAYRTFENFEPGTDGRAWLFTILYSVFFNHYHKARRDRGTVSVDELEGEFQRHLESTSDAGLVAETRQIPGESGIRLDEEVTRALAQLPADFRAAVLFVDVEGLSYDEAAAILECPVGTVRSRLYRGRRLLFGLLQRYAATQGFLRGEG